MMRFWKICRLVFLLGLVIGIVSCATDPPTLFVKNLSPSTTAEVYIDNTYTTEVLTGETISREMSQGTHTVTACPDGIIPPNRVCLEDTRDYPENFEFTLEVEF